MSLIPDEELTRESKINLAPMVDFLFLVIALLATFVITKTALYDQKMDLVKIHPSSQDSPFLPEKDKYFMHLCVTKEGSYKWLHSLNEYLFRDSNVAYQELIKQYQEGLLPPQKDKTRVLLHIDEKAPWEAIASLIFSIKEAGFHVYPVYGFDSPPS